MKQAIEEEFILDVLANYTTYKSYCEVQKSIEDNPEFDTIKAQKKLRTYVESHQQTIDTKAALMADHFLQQVVATKKLRGQARGMVVTRNIESAIRYYFSNQKELKAANAPLQAIVAFSGKKVVDGIKHTEESLTEPTDVNALHDLKDALDDAELYNEEDIEKFNELFFKGVDAEQLHPIIDETVARFDMIEEENEKIVFKIKAKQFVKLYGQLACIMPFSKVEWEKLHWFLKFLVPKLKVAEKDKDELDALLESVSSSSTSWRTSRKAPPTKRRWWTTRTNRTGTSRWKASSHKP